MNGIQNNSYRCNYALNALVHHSVVMCIPNVIKARGYVQKIAETIIGNSYSKSVPKTGLEPARLSARAPETRASTIPPPGHRVLVVQSYERFLEMQNFCRLFSVFIHGSFI